jgi:hypothetical protein
LSPATTFHAGNQTPKPEKIHHFPARSSRSAISSSFPTVFQFRAVIATPTTRSNCAADSLGRAIPFGK